MKIRFLIVLAFSFLSQIVLAQVDQTLPALQSLEVTDRLWVTLVPSDSNKIRIEGELADKVEMVISGNSLRLKMKAGYLMKGNEARVILYSPSISRLVARKGSELYVERDELQGDSLDIAVHEGAKLRAKLAANSVNVLLATGATADLMGTCQDLKVTSTAGAIFYGKDLKAQNAFVRVNAGGKTEIYASEIADVETRVGGTIDVYGNPKGTKQRKIAGGKINVH